jgi:predicted nucleic acid-binding Zn ribbon protein
MAKRTEPGGLCLMCGQPLPTRKRRKCAVCGKPILKGHKYWFDGSQVKHRNCEHPADYRPAVETNG